MFPKTRMMKRWKSDVVIILVLMGF